MGKCCMRNCYGVDIEDLEDELKELLPNWLMDFLLDLSKCINSQAQKNGLSNFNILSIYAMDQLLQRLRELDSKGGYFDMKNPRAIFDKELLGILNRFDWLLCNGGLPSLEDINRRYNGDKRNMYPDNMSDLDKGNLNDILNNNNNLNDNANNGGGSGNGKDINNDFFLDDGSGINGGISNGGNTTNNRNDTDFNTGGSGDDYGSGSGSGDGDGNIDDNSGNTGADGSGANDGDSSSTDGSTNGNGGGGSNGSLNGNDNFNDPNYDSSNTNGNGTNNNNGSNNNGNGSGNGSVNNNSSSTSGDPSVNNNNPLTNIPKDAFDNLDVSAKAWRCWTPKFDVRLFVEPNDDRSPILLTNDRIKKLKRIHDEILTPIFNFYYSEHQPNACQLRIIFGLGNHTHALKNGGNAFSRHMRGEAIDFTLVGVLPEQVQKDIISGALNIPFGVLVADSMLHMTLPYTFEGFEVKGLIMTSPNNGLDSLELQYL